MTHNYWGSAVFLDSEIGDWTEGLTMYLSDFQFLESEKGLPAARKESLKALARAIRYRPEESLKTVGMSDEERGIRYNKSALVFSGIESKIGKETFYKALRDFYGENKFKKANWETIRTSLEKISGISFESFFDQWVNRPEVPLLRVREIQVHKGTSGYVTEGTVTAEPLFKLDIPMTLDSRTGSFRTTVSLVQSPQTFRIASGDRPVRLSIDPDYSLIRKLLPEELPPVIASVLDFPGEVSVVYSSALSALERASCARFLSDRGIRFKTVTNLKEASDQVILFGPPEPDGRIGGWLPDRVPWSWDRGTVKITDLSASTDKGCAVLAWQGPRGAGQSLIWIAGCTPEALRSLSKRIDYYRYGSYLILGEGKEVLRGEWNVEATPFRINLQTSE
jgi:hypothetical protein